jgi:histidinol-phosphate aminotransferase
MDEAYAEFAEDSVIDLLGSFERLIITRTMSKAFGLAGLRIGYALGNAALIAEVEKSRGPYKVSAAAERAALAALTEDRAWVSEHVDLVKANRVRLEAALRERGLCPISSSANFVFFGIAGASEIVRRMRARGVAVRGFDDPAGLRITVGTWPQIEEALSAFDEARRECA